MRPMAMMMDESSHAWDRDDRSRAHTRGILMALSRKRDWYFELFIPKVLATAVMTLGIRPLLEASIRFDRWRRLEWVQYAELAKWLRDQTGHPIAQELVGDAEQAAPRPANPWVLRLIAVAAMVVIGVEWYATGRFSSVLVTVFQPGSLSGSAIAFSAILSVGWLVQLSRFLRQQSTTTRWLVRLNAMLAAYDKRPVLPERSRLPWGWLAVGSALAVFGPTWAAFMVVVIALQNRYISGTRAVRLQMIERMLEWMDRSGLPVEFDIEELEPEAVAASLA